MTGSDWSDEDVEAVHRLRAALLVPAPTPNAELAAFFEAPAVGVVPTAVQPGGHVPRTRTRRPAAWFVGLGLAAQIGIGTAAAAAGVATAGAADLLPGPVQGAFDSLVETAIGSGSDRGSRDRVPLDDEDGAPAMDVGTDVVRPAPADAGDRGREAQSAGTDEDRTGAPGAGPEADPAGEDNSPASGVEQGPAGDTLADASDDREPVESVDEVDDREADGRDQAEDQVDDRADEVEDQADDRDDAADNPADQSEDEAEDVADEAGDRTSDADVAAGEATGEATED